MRSAIPVTATTPVVPSEAARACPAIRVDAPNAELVRAAPGGFDPAAQ
jgi:hypothetical protein